MGFFSIHKNRRFFHRSEPPMPLFSPLHPPLPYPFEKYLHARKTLQLWREEIFNRKTSRKKREKFSIYEIFHHSGFRDSMVEFLNKNSLSSQPQYPPHIDIFHQQGHIYDVREISNRYAREWLAEGKSEKNRQTNFMRKQPQSCIINAFA